jgi:hypothetical protein
MELYFFFKIVLCMDQIRVTYIMNVANKLLKYQFHFKDDI